VNGTIVGDIEQDERLIVSQAKMRTGRLKCHVWAAKYIFKFGARNLQTTDAASGPSACPICKTVDVDRAAMKTWDLNYFWTFVNGEQCPTRIKH